MSANAYVLEPSWKQGRHERPVQLIKLIGEQEACLKLDGFVSESPRNVSESMTFTNGLQGIRIDQSIYQVYQYAHCSIFCSTYADWAKSPIMPLHTATHNQQQKPTRFYSIVRISLCLFCSFRAGVSSHGCSIHRLWRFMRVELRIVMS